MHTHSLSVTMEAVESRMKSEAAPPGPAAPTSSYIFFCKESRLREGNKGLSVTEAGSMHGKRWRALSKAKKAKFLKMAQEDRARYNSELEVYKATYGCMPPKKVKRDAPPRKDPHLPRGPRSSYMFFCRDQRARNKAAGLTVSEAGSQHGRDWRQLSAAKKAKFEALAVEDRERYNREMEIYRSVFPDPVREAKAAKKSKEATASSKKTTSGKVSTWGVNAVQSWLSDLGLPEIAQIAAMQGVDGATALEMEKADWRELGATGVQSSRITGGLKKKNAGK